MEQPTAFPARTEEEDTALELSPMHTPLIVSAGVGPAGAGSALASEADRRMSSLTHKLSTDLGTDTEREVT